MPCPPRAALRRHLLLTCMTSVSTSLIGYAALAQEVPFELNPITVTGHQETYFENTNTTALKGDFADRETPFQVSTTNDVFIKDINASNLEDIFEYTTGVARAGNNADSFTIRGFDIDLNNIKVDGLSGLTTRFGSPSTANIERVEVLKGPASVLYGNLETGGLVNLVTKKPQKEFSGSFSTSIQSFAAGISDFGEDAGIYSTLDLTGPVADRDDLFYRLILSGNDVDSFRGDINTSELNLYTSLLWEIDDVSQLTLGVEVGKQDGDADHGLAAIDNDIANIADLDTVYQDPGDFDDDEGLAITANYQRDLANGQFTFNWRSVLHRDERRLFENNRVNDNDATLRRRLRHQENTRNWHGFDTYFNTQTSTGNVSHELTFGVAGEYRKTDFNRLIFGGFADDDVDIFDPDLGGTAIAEEGNRRETNYYSLGLYAQDKITLTDALTVVASARVNRTKIDYICVRGSCNDDNTAETTDLVGSLGAVYQLNDNWTAFGSIAQSFDPYTAERVTVNGDPLDAEESLQFEGGVKYQFNDRMNVSFSAYHINKENVSESLGGGLFETVGEVESKGVELDLQWQPRDNWQFKAGYAYNDSEATEGEFEGLTPAHAPQNSAFMFTRFNVPRPVLGGTLGFSAGVSFRDDVKTDIETDSSVTLPSYFLTDIGVHFEKGDWNSSLTIANVFDETYFYAGSDDTRIYVGDPRTITLTVTRSF